MDIQKNTRSTHGFHMRDDLFADFVADIEALQKTLKFPKGAPIEKLIEYWLDRTVEEKDAMLRGTPLSVTPQPSTDMTEAFAELAARVADLESRLQLDVDHSAYQASQKAKRSGRRAK